MMNNITKEQIRLLESEYDIRWNGNTFTIIGKKEFKSPLTIGETYNIILRDYVVNEPKNFTLSSNWNRGNKFYSTEITAVIKDIKGKMILIDATDNIGNKYINMYIPSGGIESFK